MCCAAVTQKRQWLLAIAATVGLSGSLARANPFYTGADVSLLTFMQQSGVNFTDNGVAANGDQILYNAGANLFRLRIFVNPQTTYNNTNVGAIQTTAYDIALSQQIKADDPAAKILLDFHYSDTWADPGHQTLPAAWATPSETLSQLETTVQTYTTSTLQAFETAGVMPDMVQLGNETTNGMLWPTGELNFSGTQTQQNASWAAFGGLLNAGIAGVRAVQGTGPRIPIALSVDSGDKNGEPQYFYGMITKPVVTGGGSVGGAGVTDFDIEGVDYYPSNYSGTGGTGKTFAFLQSNLTALADTNTNNGTNSNPSKKIMLLENNYPYMGTANSSTEPISNYALNNYPATPNNGGSGSGNPWPATTAGQQQEFTDVRNLMMNLPGGDGEGLLWWYPEAVQVNPYNISNGGDTALFNTAGNNYTALPILSPTTGAFNVTGTITATWTAHVTTDWNTTGNWLGGAVPNGVGAEADLLAAITTPQTLSSRVAVTLGSLYLNNANSYTISGAGSLTMQVSSGSALVEVLSGTHTINLPMTLLSNTTVTVVPPTSTLSVSGGVQSASASLAMSGSGILALSGTSSIAGGVSVSAGQLNLIGGALTTPSITVSAGTLNVNGGTLSATNLTDNGTASFTIATQSIATLSGSGTLNLNPTALTISGGGTFSGPIGGSGSLTVSGSTLEIASPGSIATASVSVSSGASLKVDSGATITSTPNFTDNGTATFNNAAASIGLLNGAGTLNLNPAALTVTNGGTFSGPISGGGSIIVSGGTLEIASPGSIANTSVSVSSGAGLTVDSGAAISSATNLSDNGTVSLASASQSIATLNGSGTLNLNPTALTISGGGTFSGPANGPGTMTLTGGMLTLGGSLGASAITVNASATLNINGSVTANPALVSNGVTNFAANAGTAGPAAVALASVNIGAVGEVTVNSSAMHANRSVVEVGSLTFANTPAAPAGLLNLMDNDMIVHNGILSNITSEIAAAFNGGLWNGGGGITSSAALTAGNTTLAAVLNDNGTGTDTPLFTTFDGQPVVDSDVLVKYTYFGDANLDGVVNGSDYAMIDNGFNSQNSPDPLGGWRNGDFNYDGVINGDDYLLIDNSFNTQGSVSLAEDSAGPTEMIATDTTQIDSSTAVPEPAMGLGAFAAAAIFLRRNRYCRALGKPRML
jgi:arabinogalactan endo-1,4-beta-galactosidase